MSLSSLVHRTVPSTLGPPPHPVVVLLHGLGSNELDLLGLAQYLDPRAFYVSVRAPFEYHGFGYMWYDLERDGLGLGTAEIERSLSILPAFLRDIDSAYPVDLSRMYLVGFSQGAAIAGALALLEPTLVAGVVMASGYLPPDPTARYRRREKETKLPVFQAHGTFDTVVPLGAAHQTRDLMQLLGVDLTYREYPMAHEIGMPELTDIREWFEWRLKADDPANMPGS